MKLFLWVFVIVFASCFLISAEEQSPSVSVLRAARMWDAHSSNAITNGVVVIENGKISKVGTGIDTPANAKVIDLGDVTLLPGFIDLHTHTTSEMGQNFLQTFYENLRMSVPEETLHASMFARRILDAGFTTIRNLGCQDRIDVGLRNAISKGWVVGPRIIAATNALGARGGHCDSTGFPEGRFGQESSIKDGIAAGPDEFRDAVRYQVKYGADVIKVCATGGVLSLGDEVDTPQITQAEMDAIVDEAHRLRKKVAVRCSWSGRCKSRDQGRCRYDRTWFVS